MIEKLLDIETSDGAMNSFIVYPEEKGRHPVVLFYMDAPGKREELHDMARRLAAVGYYVVLPNLYYRRTRDFWLTERIKCIASIHGANLVTDGEDSAHLMAPRIRCESYFACAEIDKWASPEIIDTLQAALVAGGTPHRIEWYPGVEHGFVFPHRAGIYNQPAAERHWERLFSLFAGTLKPV